MIQAKPVVNDRYWILKQGDRKIGQAEADDSGITIKIQGKSTRYTTIRMAGRAADIEFELVPKVTAIKTNQVHGYDAKGKIFNPVWDVKHRLPLYTKDSKSKSWFAAGWYAIKQHRKWKIVHCPKLIALQRYTFSGPFHSKQEAEEHQ